LELSRLENRLGERSEEAGTMAAFDMIGLLWEDGKRVDKLEEKFNEKGADWEANLIKKCSEVAKLAAGGDPSTSWENNFLDKLKIELTPVLELFMKTLSAPEKLGDLLEARLNQLDQEVASLGNKLAGVSSTIGWNGNHFYRIYRHRTVGWCELWPWRHSDCACQSNACKRVK